MKKKVLFLLFTMLMIFCTAYAEQPMAEKYRELFKSGNFYIEYGVAGLRGLNRVGTDLMGVGYNRYSATKYKKASMYLKTAAYNGMRMKGLYGSTSFAMDFLGGRLELNNKKIAPDVLYAKGKYYRTQTSMKREFFNTKAIVNAIMLPEEKLTSKNLNPAEKWDTVRSDLAIPMELSIFYSDSYNDEDLEMPKYTGSKEQSVNDKKYVADEYVRDRGNFKEVYRALYDNGEIVYVQYYEVTDKGADLISIIDIRKISAEVPMEIFNLPNGTKIYAADEGKMHNLIEQKVLIEEVGKNKGESK